MSEQGLRHRGTGWSEPTDTHTGLKLGVDVAQREKGLIQDVLQGRVSHSSQDPPCQGQLSLQCHRALPHLSRGDRQLRAACERGQGRRAEGAPGGGQERAEREGHCEQVRRRGQGPAGEAKAQGTVRRTR